MFLIFVYLFLVKLRFPKNTPLSSIITNRYGQPVLKVFRQFEKSYYKKEKCIQDLIFLKKCKVYNVMPKFLYFKLYNKNLHNSVMYKRWQNKLLNTEINNKNKHLKKMTEQTIEFSNQLKSRTTFIDYYYLNFFVKKHTNITIDKVKSTHNNKLNRLGINNDLQPLDPNKVIFNHSNRVLSHKEKFMLSLGLNFKLPIFRINYFKYFYAFENLYYILSKFPISQFQNAIPLKTSLQNIACKYFFNFKPYKVFSPIIKKSDFNILKNLSKDDSIVITRPDKGQGVVILNKTDYIAKMNEIISDTSKFKKIENIDPLLYTLRKQDKLNRTINSIKKAQIISESVANSLTTYSSTPGIMYGLPKVHKPNIPLRPILSANNTTTYNLSKYLVDLLSNIDLNQHTVKNSYEFSKFITSIPNADSYTMCSFDVKSLFTNIPLDETIDICINRLFPNPDSTFHNYDKKQFKNILQLATKDTNFMFNDSLYQQIDGVGMGQPCAPTLANIFMGHHEDKWLKDCPHQFKPLHYCRYVDDTFLLFNNINQIEPFLDYINEKHPNIQFTKEIEQNNSLPFLDINIHKINNRFETSIYRKPTFTGLGSSFFSFDPIIYKINAIKTLIHRAYHISSTYVNFNKEIYFLVNFFQSNGYPLKLFNKHLKSFLSSIFEPKPPLSTVAKQVIYFSIPYLGYVTDDLRKDLIKVINLNFPQLNLKLVSSNSNSISSYFKHKEKLDPPLCSGVVYLYECLNCQVQYVGSTSRQLAVRTAEHLGISPRTKLPLASPPFSSIREHAYNTSHPILPKSFSIINQSSNNLRLIESLHIHKRKPNLNQGSPWELVLSP